MEGGEETKMETDLVSDAQSTNNFETMSDAVSIDSQITARTARTLVSH